MRTLVIYAHPVEDSYCAALHRCVVDTLRARGAEVDDLDLYAEGFDPVLSRAERIAYHETGPHRATVQPYIDRLFRAEALVLVYPVWNFGFPAIMKGFLDRVFLPDVSFRLENGLVYPNLDNIRQLTAVCTYGAHRWRAWAAGDPPRRLVCRVMRSEMNPRARIRYLARYDMNRVTGDQRARFLERVAAAMAAP